MAASRMATDVHASPKRLRKPVALVEGASGFEGGIFNRLGHDLDLAWDAESFTV